MSDGEVNKIIIVIQTPPCTRPPKHEGYDRTGDWTTRVKMTQDLAKVINDGLFYYEQDLWSENDGVSILPPIPFLASEIGERVLMAVLRHFSTNGYTKKWASYRKKNSNIERLTCRLPNRVFLLLLRHASMLVIIPPTFQHFSFI